jgi:quercetin dioxygenase-like cupin family protein
LRVRLEARALFDQGLGLRGTWRIPRRLTSVVDRREVTCGRTRTVFWVNTVGLAAPVLSAVLYGDPNQPGPYAVRNRFSPGTFSRPHFHPNDRFIIVVSGTWWVGTGEKFDPDGTKPMPAGSFVVHYGGKVHYDGAKNEECEVIIYGMGPGTSTRVGAN